VVVGEGVGKTQNIRLMKNEVKERKATVDFNR
jgi:hypothetical protein